MLTSKPAFALLSVLLLLSTTALQADLYTDAQLRTSKSKVEHDVRAMITSDIPRKLSGEKKRRLANVRVDLPLRGRNPLDFYSISAQDLVVAPVSSIRFFDDLGILSAWFEYRSCDARYIQAYLHSLLRQGNDLGNPIAAFGLDRDRLLSIPDVDSMSLKITKSGLYFVFAHELGHISHNHRGGLAPAPSIAQEIEADRFAIDVFAATGEPPAGAVVFFMALRWGDPLDKHAARHSHPLSPQRIRVIGERMTAEPSAFAHASEDQAAARARAREIGRSMIKLSDGLDDDALLTLLPVGFEREMPVSSFRSACPD
jgi:hypothetical protein